jgi:hypothetical protein
MVLTNGNKERLRVGFDWVAVMYTDEWCSLMKMAHER